MRWFWGCLVLAFLLPTADASAQNVYESNSKFYSFQMPMTWSVVRERQNEDVVIASPAGISRGSIYIVLAAPKGSLQDDANHTFGGGGVTVQSKRTRMVDRFSCLHVTVTSGRGVPHHNVFCQFTVPYKEGPRRVDIMFGQAMHPNERFSRSRSSRGC